MTDSKDSLRLELGHRSYDIAVGGGLLDTSGPAIHSATGGGKCWIVTDETVAATYLAPLEGSLHAAGLAAETIIVPPGEASKNFTTVEKIVNSVLDGAPERSSTMIALGGGVIGDLTGFAASIILRGINFVQIPTTLLAQVDSSVGGKTGINTRHGKNLAGAFYQPKLVIADTCVLDTLPRRELLAGYAEVLKYGLIRDMGFFEWLEQNGAALLNGDSDARAFAVRASCAAKAAVVAQDEHENGVRALLNFGHTFGHALEAETGYGVELLHGEAVAIGMMMALELSAMLNLCAAADIDRVRRHYETTGLPMTVPKMQKRNWDPAMLVRHMGHDKKIQDGKIRFILVRAIGEAFVAGDVNLDDVQRLLNRAVAA